MTPQKKYVDMASTKERIGSEIESLLSQGKDMLDGLLGNKPGDVLSFASKYHGWYTRALPVVRALVPDRFDEFRRQYERIDKRKVSDAVSYVIEDYVQGVQAPVKVGMLLQEPAFDVNTVAYAKFNTQVGIVASSLSRLDYILADIRGVLQADLFDSELDAARHLLRNGHIRAAGSVAGVVLEGHLAEVCARHNVAIPKKDPHINDFNEELKKADVFDVSQWRRIQSLADIRNLCDHKKQRDPTPDEVTELVDGVDKAIKTLT